MQGAWSALQEGWVDHLKVSEHCNVKVPTCALHAHFFFKSNQAYLYSIILFPFWACIRIEDNSTQLCTHFAKSTKSCKYCVGRKGSFKQTRFIQVPAFATVWVVSFVLGMMAGSLWISLSLSLSLSSSLSLPFLSLFLSLPFPSLSVCCLCLSVCLLSVCLCLWSSGPLIPVHLLLFSLSLSVWISYTPSSSFLVHKQTLGLTRSQTYSIATCSYCLRQQTELKLLQSSHSQALSYFESQNV